MVYFKWNGGRAAWKVRQAIAYAMEYAAQRLLWRIRHALNTPYPPASEPGEYPHRRTGLLRNSVRYTIDKKRLIVNIVMDEKAYYWRFLERGTKFMEARPFLAPVTNKMRPQIKTELMRAAKREMKK